MVPMTRTPCVEGKGDGWEAWLMWGEMISNAWLGIVKGGCRWKGGWLRLNMRRTEANKPLWFFKPRYFANVFLIHSKIGRRQWSRLEFYFWTSHVTEILHRRSPYVIVRSIRVVQGCWLRHVRVKRPVRGIIMERLFGRMNTSLRRVLWWVKG